MCKFRRDVALHLVDPVHEYQRLYPDHLGFESPAAATAALFSHYDVTRHKQIDKRVAPTFWAGPHELRAMAQYLREPIVVFDVNAHNDAHMQCYLYKQYRLPDGTDHESGYGKSFTDREATEYLKNCWDLHIISTCMVLRHHERHFYGVSHGELYLQWRAEGDAELAETISDSYTWKSTINQLTESERKTDLQTVNQLVNMDSVNWLLCKRMEMRERLDVAHARLGLPVLESSSPDFDAEAAVTCENQQIHEEYGLDHLAASSPTPGDSSSKDDEVPTRIARVATGTVVTNSYFRILRDSPDSPMDHVDKPLAVTIEAANCETFRTWCELFRAKLKIPTTKRRRGTAADIMEWLFKTPEALRHLYAFLPYPEQEAKT
ncbi:hypothetical protein GN958_ATG06922 [Phytophthora infestans]|uniref:Uncharacterized protein n=1 Tax=Phytophthora infestans TaxID=4787 RepID=A0A8S9US85_PHYIN|nr:hypothetical protein GN958_ATG06922 [Phytophthora infestans]